jgi:hypothetical protein
MVLVVCVLSGLCVFFALQSRRWKEKYQESEDRYDGLIEEAVDAGRSHFEAQKELDLLKSNIAALASRPVYATITDSQVQTIVALLKAEKDKTWLN